MPIYFYEDYQIYKEGEPNLSGGFLKIVFAYFRQNFGDSLKKIFPLKSINIPANTKKLDIKEVQSIFVDNLFMFFDRKQFI